MLQSVSGLERAIADRPKPGLTFPKLLCSSYALSGTILPSGCTASGTMLPSCWYQMSCTSRFGSTLRIGSATSYHALLLVRHARYQRFFVFFLLSPFLSVSGVAVSPLSSFPLVVVAGDRSPAMSRPSPRAGKST